MEVVAAKASSTAGATAEAPPGAAEPSRMPWGTVLGASLIVLAVVGAVVWFLRVPPPEPIQGGFAFVTPAPSATPARAVPPPAGSAAFEEGNQRLLRGDAAGAEPLLAKAASEAPDNALYRLTYGRCLDLLGKTSAALAELRAARRLQPSSTSAGLALASLLARDNQGDEAIRLYQSILQAQPGELGALQGLARVYVAQNQDAEAVPYLRRVVEASPSDLLKKQDFAEALFNSGNPSESATVLRQIVEARPNAAVSRVWLAESLVAQNKHDEAEQVLRAGLALDAEAPLLQRALGTTLERAGKFKEAAAAYRAYVKLAPNAPDAKDWTDRASQMDPPPKG